VHGVHATCAKFVAIGSIAAALLTLPETLKDETAGFDAEEGVLGGGVVEASRLGVGEERVRPTVTFPERVRPPDAAEHLVADAQFVVAVVEAQSLVVPLLPEVEIQREILPATAFTSSHLS